jgi:hypothetical protein
MLAGDLLAVCYVSPERDAQRLGLRASIMCKGVTVAD